MAAVVVVCMYANLQQYRAYRTYTCVYTSYMNQASIKKILYFVVSHTI